VPGEERTKRRGRRGGKKSGGDLAVAAKMTGSCEGAETCSGARSARRLGGGVAVVGGG